MFKSFGKVFVVSLIVVALTAPLAFGTTSRVRSLAHSGDYLNDDSNVFRWYATLPSYSNLVMAEVGTYSGYDAYHQALGITHACGEDGQYGTFAVFLMDNVTDDGFYMTSPLGMMTHPFDMPDNKFAIQWGKEFEGLALGLGFTRSDEGMSNGYAANISFTTFGGGIRTDLGDNAYADLALTFGMAGGENIIDDAGAPDTSDFDKKNVLDVAARIFYEWKDYVTLVPLFDFQMMEFALENPSYEPHGEKGTAFRFGLAMNMDVNTNNMIIFGVEYQRMKFEPSVAADPDDDPEAFSEYTAAYLPTFRLALESDVKPWMTARVGAMKSLVKETYKDAGGEEVSYTDSFFDWYLGVGFHIAEFDIDCELGEETPFGLGYWLTGHTAYPGGNGPISRISATYHF
jgi:hypothetical protein